MGQATKTAISNFRKFILNIQQTPEPKQTEPDEAELQDTIDFQEVDFH